MLVVAAVLATPGVAFAQTGVDAKPEPRVERPADTHSAKASVTLGKQAVAAPSPERDDRSGTGRTKDLWRDYYDRLHPSFKPVRGYA